MRGAEIDRKLYTEDLDSLTGGIFFFFSPPTYSAYKGAPISFCASSQALPSQITAGMGLPRETGWEGGRWREASR